MGRKYSISIQAHGDDTAGAPPKISAVMQVDEDGTLQLVELTVGASDGGPIPPGVARNIDFALLAHALSGVVVATLPSSEKVVTNPQLMTVPTQPVAAEVAQSAGAPSAGAPSSGAPSSGAPSAAGRPAKAGAAVKERPYRRMPDLEEVREVIERTRSVGKLAQHFNVPRYTAQAWVDRLRRHGQLDQPSTQRP